jgi:hypothetical protein
MPEDAPLRAARSRTTSGHSRRPCSSGHSHCCLSSRVRSGDTTDRAYIRYRVSR